MIKRISYKMWLLPLLYLCISLCTGASLYDSNALKSGLFSNNSDNSQSYFSDFSSNQQFVSVFQKDIYTQSDVFDIEDDDTEIETHAYSATNSFIQSIIHTKIVGINPNTVPVFGFIKLFLLYCNLKIYC
jgi:hypothetical protein